MTEGSALSLLWALLGGHRGYHVLELANYQDGRVDLWSDVTNRRRFTRICEHHGWNSGLAISARPYADLGSRRLMADCGAVWVRTESARQVNALEAFDVEPTLILRVGGTVHHIAFWGITRPLSPEDGEKVNRHLAHKLRVPKKHAAQMMFPPPGAVVRDGKPKAVAVAGGSGEPVTVRRLCRTLPRTIPDPAAWRQTAHG